MLMSRSSFALVGIGIVGLGGFLRAVGNGADEPVTAVVNDPQFHSRLLKIAEVYTAYGRVDDEFRWAPWFCRMPDPSQPRFSQSADETTHGRKLYSVFARDRDSYMQNPETIRVGQIIVKESWVPQELAGKLPLDPVVAAEPKFTVPKDLAPLGIGAILTGSDHFRPFAQKKDKWYRAKERGPLFIMYKLDPDTQGTDHGWVYGTVTANGKTATSAGRVASCMKCHETKKDRLFGLRSSEVKTSIKPPVGGQK
jgi:hypothetical protein